MKRIAFLGCENSHADAFIKFIQANPEDFSDVEIVGVYSDDITKSQKLNEKYGVPVMADYADAVGKLDGVVITAPDIEHGGVERTIIVFFVYYRR